MLCGQHDARIRSFYMCCKVVISKVVISWESHTQRINVDYKCCNMFATTTERFFTSRIDVAIKIKPWFTWKSYRSVHSVSGNTYSDHIRLNMNIFRNRSILFFVSPGGYFSYLKEKKGNPIKTLHNRYPGKKRINPNTWEKSMFSGFDFRPELKM